MSEPMRTFVGVPVTGLSVDAGSRTIEGLAVPYGPVARNSGGRFRFAAGALRWADVGRVKLLLNHDVTKPIGKALSLSETPEGLRARFQVAPGQSGDEALALAADGVLDGLSVGVDFTADGLDRDPADNSVMLVRRGDLREVSLTAMPAFDDARVTRVAASREGAGMPAHEEIDVQAETTVSAALSVHEADAMREGPTPVNPIRPVPAGRLPAYGGQNRAVGFAADRHPLTVTAAAMDALQAALDAHEPVRLRAADPDAQFATLTTSTIGAPRAWGANSLNAPRLLSDVAGVPRQPIDAVFAQFPSLTLPTAQSAASEGSSLVEYASSAAGSVTLGRFGRWTDLTLESQIGANAESIMSMHRLAIALDLDKVLIDAVETAAGSAVAFTADVPGAIRKAMSKVLAQTATQDPGDLVILVHPDNADLLQDVTPIGGNTIGERFQRFSGAMVYPSTAVNTGFMTVANLRIGARYFEASGMRVLTFQDPKTGVETAATFLVGGYGVTLTTGFAVMVDVVTP